MLKKHNYKWDFTNTENYLLVLYASSLPFGHALSNILLVPILGFLIYRFITGTATISRKDRKWLLLFSTYFVVFLISLIYTENFTQGVMAILRKAVIVVFPIYIFSFLSRISRQWIDKALFGYVVSTIVVCLFSLIIVLAQLAGSSEGFRIESISGEVIASAFVTYHKLYFSLYILIAIYFLNYNKSLPFFTTKHSVYKHMANGLFLVVLILLTSRSILFMAVVLLIIIPIINEFRRKNYKRIGVILLAITALVTVNIFFNPQLVEKFKEAVNYNNEYHIKKKWGGTSVRKLIWEYSYYVVRDNPIIGVGIGDMQQELDASYKNCTESSALKQANYNAHNDILQILVGTGILGLLMIVLAYGNIFYHSLKTTNYFHCGLLLIFLFAGLTESFLEREMGIRILAFFSPLLFIANRE